MSCKRELKNENGNNVFDHLTPKTQVLFNEAKKFQKEYSYKFCWTKNSNVLLKESEFTNLVRVTNRDVLENLKNSSFTNLVELNITSGVEDEQDQATDRTLTQYKLIKS